MSQNKTVFPGIGQDDDFNPQYRSAASGAYARPAGRQAGTIWPGMEEKSIPGNSQTGVTRQTAGGKPIAGFLYSISRTGVGEYWPLHVGQNLIGRSPECDIVLPEGTVSARHANLHINRMKKPAKTEATISHLGAMNGVEVNENSVSVAHPMECVNGDIITIGECYQLLLILIDTKALGLQVAENFIHVEEADIPGPGPGPVFEDRSTRHPADFPHFDGPDSFYDGGARPTDSTVGMDPTQQEFRSGGTKPM